MCIFPPDNVSANTSSCIIGISGYSGTGKTTLIEKILPILKKEGLSVGVMKHIHHNNLDIDKKGKDTDRFYRAGADYIFAHDERQGFARSRCGKEDLSDLADRFPRGLDLILIEGHKGYVVPGIWVEIGKIKTGGPAEMKGKEVICRDDPRYLDKVLSRIHKEMERSHAQRVINAGLLIGGKSTRMGRPKALLMTRGKTLVERSFDILSEVSSGKVMMLGSGPLPQSLDAVERLPDVTGLKGPLSGLLSAFRWAPGSAWIISSVDMPLMHKEAWEWLLSLRRPGVWAVLPKIKGSKGVETTGAVYEPMIFEYVESLARKEAAKLQEIARHPKVVTPVIPGSLALAWKNVNTGAEWKKALEHDARKMS
ncbi:MAG: molybdopterin-guanine dinucleotide biosynthesis protein B [Nitrospirae bacterium]|nr:molybdopterin-guanine dinucleotide biosynthesis protein B [Nitrospirota bacterium]